MHLHASCFFLTYLLFLPGVEASEQGCTKGQVFNPVTSSCDKPDRVPGCENYYHKPTKTKVIGSFVFIPHFSTQNACQLHINISSFSGQSCINAEKG